MYSLIHNIIGFLLLASLTEGLRDFGSQSTIIETDSLPTLSDGVSINFDRMPYIGNGHIATTVYNDSIFMNGIYNGEKSQSRRARIPAEINLRVHFNNEHSRQIYRQYRLDMKNGYWEENVTVEECRVTQRVYAHQYYTRLLVVDIFAQRQGAATGNLMLYLNTTRGPDSKDFKFSQKMSFNGGNWCVQGTTQVPEVSGGHNSQIYMYWSIVPPIIHIPSHQNSIRHTFIMSIDTNEEVAKESFESGTWIADKTPDHFFDQHKEAWMKKWQDGSIELSGEDTYLEKLAHSSFYYILSSLPSVESHRQRNEFGGISSTGLAGSSSDPEDQGAVSWDQERWIMPAILPFFPNLAKSMLSYRVNTKPAAHSQARSKNLLGLLYSWQSSATGIDTTPSYLPRNHYHLSGDISYAARQFVSMTRDKLWLQEDGGCSLIRDIAHFWYTLAKWNTKTRRYDILDSTPPDDTLGSVDNSVYTNVVASLSLHYAKYAACMCNVDVNVFAPLEWLFTAQNLHYEYNNTQNFNPEYHNFLSDENTKILRQPGALLLKFPLLWDVAKSTVERNLRLYGASLPPHTPSTTWSILTVNWLELDEKGKAEQFFEKSYNSYVQEPFKIWTELSAGGGKSNYLSGMASFLQTLLYGYGGLRIHVEHLTMNPMLPPKVHSMTFNDIDYLGSKFSLRVTSVIMHLSVKAIGVYPLILTLKETGKQYHLVRGASIPLPRGEFLIQTKARTGCPMPEDNILPVSIKSNYSPRPQSASTCVQQTSSINVLLLTLLLYNVAMLYNYQWYYSIYT